MARRVECSMPGCPFPQHLVKRPPGHDHVWVQGLIGMKFLPGIYEDCISVNLNCGCQSHLFCLIAYMNSAAFDGFCVSHKGAVNWTSPRGRGEILLGGVSPTVSPLTLGPFLAGQTSFERAVEVIREVCEFIWNIIETLDDLRIELCRQVLNYRGSVLMTCFLLTCWVLYLRRF